MSIVRVLGLVSTVINPVCMGASLLSTADSVFAMKGGLEAVVTLNAVDMELLIIQRLVCLRCVSVPIWMVTGVTCVTFPVAQATESALKVF